MKVMHYVHNYCGYSGASKQALSLSKELEKLGCEQIFVSEFSGNLPVNDNKKNCTFVKKNIFGLIKFIYCLSSFKPDVVHFHGASFKYLLLASFFSKVYWKTTLNGSDDFYSLTTSGGKLRCFVKKKLLNFIDINNALTRQNYDINAQYLSENKIVVIPNGVFLDENLPFKKQKVVVIVATVIPRKRIKEAIFFFKINFEPIGYKLLIIGPYDDVNLDGYDKEYVRYCLSFKSDNIAFLGNLNSKKVYEILKTSAYLLLFSMKEGMPNVVLEALSFGVVPVVTCMGGVSNEIFAGSSVGIIIDEESLEKEIIFPDICINKFNECRSHIRSKFALQRIATATNKVYLEMVNKNVS